MDSANGSSYATSEADTHKRKRQTHGAASAGSERPIVRSRCRDREGDDRDRRDRIGKAKRSLRHRRILAPALGIRLAAAAAVPVALRKEASDPVHRGTVFR